MTKLNKTIIETIGILALMISLITISSCTKKADGNLGNQQKGQQTQDSAQSTAVDTTNLKETVENLTSTDFKDFYEKLSAKGEWIQVSEEELGLKSKPTASGNFGEMKSIKASYTIIDANPGMVFVWKPSQDLAVNYNAGSDPVYVPYSNGQWVNSDAGWYFKAPTPEEEIVHHYGRWENSPTDGWLWVPGRVWAPSYVDWRQNDNYTAWTPTPPMSYVNPNYINDFPYKDNYYTTVENRYFLEPQVYKHRYIYDINRDGNVDRNSIAEMRRLDGITYADNRIINKGPGVSLFEIVYGRPIETVQISHVKYFTDVNYSDNRYFVYTPGFREFKNKDHGRWASNQPNNFRKFDEDRDKKNRGNREDNNYNNENDKNKNKDNDGKKFKEKINPGDDRQMKERNDKGNKHESNDRWNKHEGNDKENKHERNDNGKKQNDDNKKQNDNGSKNEGNDYGKKQNDNGNKHDGNDIGKEKGKNK